jgi:diaminopimelate decarboxylase
LNIPGFVAPYCKSDDAGEFLIGGISASVLASRYGTPVFLYDQSVLERKYAALRKALPARFSISYSVKANPNPAFLRFFLSKGCGLEIASAGEFYQAQNAGCFPDDILFAGPGKTEPELELAVAQGIGEIHVESKVEAERISAIGRKLGVCTGIAIRVNPSEGRGGAMCMGGKSAPFGVDEEQLDALLYLINSDSYLDFRGIHLFVGTQILDHTLLLSQYRKGVEIARRAAAFTQKPIQTLDFGGGLGIPYFPGDVELDLKLLGEGLHELMRETENEECFAQTRFVVEPGRFLVGEAGVYVARVNDIKTSRGKKYLILDGGMNHHLAASGNLGQVIKRNPALAILNKLHMTSRETVDVVGPLCTPLDTLGRSVELPEAEIGDLVGIFQSGAYARTASPLGFLSHPAPPEVWIENGLDFLIRRRGEFSDSLRDVQPLDTVIRRDSSTVAA